MTPPTVNAAPAVESTNDDSDSSPASERALAEAAEWRVRLDVNATEADRAAFDRWLAADRDHAKAWHEIGVTWNTLSQTQQPGLTDALERVRQEEKRESRRLLRNTVGGVLLLVAAGWLSLSLDSPSHLLADHYTAIGERASIVLPDGSRLDLNTGSAVDVLFGERYRRIVLYDGELHIAVARDTNRPLEVVTNEGTVRALGTRFSVRKLDRDEDAIRVTVYESRVRLCVDENEDCRRLRGGQQVQAGAGQIGQISTVIKGSSPSWLRGRLEVSDQPVTAVLDELTRHYRGMLHYDRDALAGLRVSGTLPLDDIPHALDALAATLPIKIKRYTDWVLVVSRLD